jgi:hypothetical protein
VHGVVKTFGIIRRKSGQQPAISGLRVDFRVRTSPGQDHRTASCGETDRAGR